MNWNHCTQLIKFELRNTPFYKYLLNIGVAIIFGWLFADILSNYFTESRSTPVIDMLLIIGISANSYMFRGYPFFLREVNNNLYIAPIQIHLRQLPFSEKTLIVSRLLSGFIFSIMSSISFIVILHIFLTTHHLAQIVSFSICWLMLVLSSSSFVTAAEPGSAMTKFYATFWTFFIVFLFFGASTLIQRITGHYFFEWYLIGTKEAPLLLTIIILVLSLLLFRLSLYYMNKYLSETDYHI
ncbi:hypothetical protein [Evansella cellulosilytica]|uniref:hypothetical protein n=1 Tax=Evansella cellulosilytica TaxID=1413 RepID=UPI0002F9910E|nr:hypothetical protein [Evansella cellulosilytica]